MSDASIIIAIGASTGGTEAIEEVLTRLPASTPGVVITQHIPPAFSLAFAKRLNEICPMEVKEAAHGDTLARGRAYRARQFHVLPQICRGRRLFESRFRTAPESVTRGLRRT